VVGVLVPRGRGPYPPLVVLPGTSPGFIERDAMLFARHGYAALALAIFGVGRLPKTLIEVPLEHFESAIAWLRSQDGVAGDRLGIVGGSRGGELALLLGATLPAITAVVSLVGSGVITQGVAFRPILEELETHQPAFTYRGRPLPFLPARLVDEQRAQVREGRPVALGLAFEAALANVSAVEEATIPVERIGGPVLLISATDDHMWPSSVLSAIAERRLRREGHRHHVEHLCLTAGHGIAPPPYAPTTTRLLPGPSCMFALGGTARDDAHGRETMWEKTLEFLAAHLAK
jgi:dienelactone hydrolase